MATLFGPVISNGCRAGVLRWAPAHHAFERCAHVLTDANGNILLSVRSDRIALDRLVGQTVTLCGQLQVYLLQSQPVRQLLVAGTVQVHEPARQAGCG